MLEYCCFARTYVKRTYPKSADSVSAIKEKPSILSHTSTDIWHRFKFRRPMFTTYWFQRFAFRNILNQFLRIWYSLAISFTTKFESQKSNYFWYFAILLSLCKKSKRGPIFAVSISMRQKRKWFSLYPSPFLSLPLPLPLSLSLSLSISLCI